MPTTLTPHEAIPDTVMRGSPVLFDLVPDFADLPIGRRTRVLVLGVLQTLLDRSPRLSARVLDRAPNALAGRLRRWAQPVRVAGARRTAVDPVAVARELEPRVLASSTRSGPPAACVVVPTSGAMDWLQACLLSVRAYTDLPYQLVVVDDGSENPEAVERVAAHVGAELVRSTRNGGFAAAVNLGAQRARAPAIAILNDDAIVTPGWLAGLLEVLASSPSIALVGPVSNDTGDMATLDASYSTLDELLSFARQPRGAPCKVDKLSLFCGVVRRDVFERVEGLDEGYGRGLFEDDDFCMSLRQRGLETLLVPAVFVHHGAGKTFRRLSPFEYLARFEVNRSRFERRWGVSWRNVGSP